ncbi:MAG: acyl-CoA dehydrogenase [Deltaproteobacteria bacterium RBG_16_54_11]|jgi:acyl-CoA dehydrogenase|nr:MAG: acyl-CoA dehydrogenase [Deltaproteobacteria bacterium RBG_16_54_11]
MLDFTLSPEQLEIQRQARDFALKEILPKAAYYDELNVLPIDILKKAFDAGLLNGGIPKKYGGRGLGLIEGVLITEELSAACLGLATSLSDNGLGIEPIILSNKEDLKKKYLTILSKEPKFICFATSEPTMGSDVAGMLCHAAKKGNDYILNGTKYWITNAGIADYMTVFATVDPKSQHEGICAFVVERDWEGVSTGEHIQKLGQRASNTAALNFKNVVVPKENVLAEPGEGFVLAMRTFSRTRPSIGAFAVGAARSAMEFAIDYAKKRQAFGMKLQNYEAIQFKIAEMYQKMETSRLLVLKSAWESDNGMDSTISASIAKFYATEAAFEVASEAMQIAGGYGYTRMFPFEKILRDVRLLMIYEGTSEIQRVIVAGHALGNYKPVMPPLEELAILRSEGTGKMFDDEMKGKTAWRCRMCGYVHYGDNPPDECPSCFFPSTAFKKVWPA